MLDKPTAHRNIVLALKLTLVSLLIFAGDAPDRGDRALWLITADPSPATSTCPSRRRCRLRPRSGVALVLFGLVPDARIWRLALVSIGVTIAIIFGAQWVRAAIAEYRDLPD